MRDYGILSAKFWIGETGRKLHGDTVSQTLATYLISSNHSSMTGLYYCPKVYMSDDTGIPIEGVSKALSKLIKLGFCEYDEKNRIVFVINMARIQVGTKLSIKDKRRIGMLKELSRLPSTPLLASFVRKYSVSYNIEPGYFGKIQEAPPIPLRSQDQDQDQDQDQEQEDRGDTSAQGAPSAQQPLSLREIEASGDVPFPEPPSDASQRLAAIWKAMQTQVFLVAGVGEQVMWNNVKRPEPLAKKLDDSCPNVDVPGLITKLSGWTFANPKKMKKDLARFVWNAAMREQDNPRSKQPVSSGYQHGSDLAAKVRGNGRRSDR